MYGQQGAPRRSGGSKAGGVIFAVIAVIAVLGWIGAHAAQSVQVTTCNTVLQSCTQTSYPVQPGSP